MTVRMDKFSVGDTVMWRPDLHEADHFVKDGLGEGPFRLCYVEDVQDSHPDDHGEHQSTWEAMGHTQAVNVEGDPKQSPLGRFSGAWFVKVA